MNDFITESPKITGFVLIIFALALMLYNLKRRDRFNFEEFGFLD